MTKQQKRIVLEAIRAEVLNLCGNASKIAHIAFCSGRFIDGGQTLVFVGPDNQPHFTLSDDGRRYMNGAEFIRSLFEHGYYRRYFDREKLVEHRETVNVGTTFETVRIAWTRKHPLTQNEIAEFERLEKTCRKKA
ncbi:MAG TPA: hypothetical protein PKB02_13165 [Anaerohalosphaeraceae bacterium]|nr:hypothetical protein [Anaerohalosphaeraceae bacterium]